MSNNDSSRVTNILVAGIGGQGVMTAAEILETGIPHVILATGARYRRDGHGRSIHHPIPGHDLPNIFTPDDIMDGNLPTGRVILYDDDHFYLGGVLAETLAQNGCDLTLVTAAPLEFSSALAPGGRT